MTPFQLVARKTAIENGPLLRYWHLLSARAGAPSLIIPVDHPVQIEIPRLIPRLPLLLLADLPVNVGDLAVAISITRDHAPDTRFELHTGIRPAAILVRTARAERAK